MRPLLFLSAAVLLALGAYSYGRLQAAGQLVTDDEINTVNVVAKVRRGLVEVIARIPLEKRTENGPPDEIGSGFFYKPTSVLTNYHVVQFAERITLRLSSGKIVPAKLTAVDVGLDLALLSVSGVSAPGTLPFGSSANLIQGQKTIVMGSPLGTPNFVSSGLLATRGRTDPPADDVGLEIPEMLHTTATVLPGNSGGPMMDSKGQVIGVIDASLGGNDFTQSGFAGLAIPIDVVKEAVSDLEKVGVPQRGNLGITLTSLGDIAPIIRKQAGLSSTNGAIVEEVPAGSVGARAGLRGAIRDGTGELSELGDVIVGVDGQAVQDRFEIVRLIAAKRPGQSLTLEVWRNKRKVTLKTEIVKRTQ